MNVSFAPLRPDAVDYASRLVGIDYRYGEPFPGERWLTVTVRDDEGRIMGVIVAEFINWFEAQFHAAVTNPRCVTRRLLRSVFTALFSRAKRLTAFVETGNARAIRNAVRMGFVLEGVCRLGINGTSDAYTYGMLREDCKFLPGYTRGTTLTMELDHGQRRTRPTRSLEDGRSPV